MTDFVTVMAPSPLDEVFAHAGEGTTSVILALTNNPSFIAAVEVGIAAELDQQASEVGHPAHPGPGPGQSGRVQFLANLGRGIDGGYGNTPAA